MGVLLAPLFGIYLMIVFSAPPEPLPPAVTDTVILLPDEDGRVGAVVVTTASGGEQTLDTAYATVAVDEEGALETRVEDAATIQAQYGGLLSATPPQPKSFVVTFEAGSSDQLTTASLQTIDEMKVFLQDRPAPEISIIGHTDRVGSDADNDVLSLARAEAVQKLIEEMGVEAQSLQSSGRGEREPIVATADKVSEVRNRRVEINIR
ncbi:MAG: OmpA family protein [Halioglobus sp.]